MSDDLYSTLLRWNGIRGLAKLHGASVELSAAPNLGEGPVWGIAYRPEIGEKLIQVGVGEIPRHMLPHEIIAADRFLREITKDKIYDEPFDGLGPGDGLGTARWLRD